MVANRIHELRDTIDTLDESIILLLGQRYKICKKVGEYKKHNSIPMMQFDRITEVMNKVVFHGKGVNIPEAVIRKLYEVIIDSACDLETSIIDADHHTLKEQL